MKIFKIIPTILLITLLSSCGKPLNINEAKLVAQQYIELLNKQKFDEALAISSGDFSTDELKKSSIERMTALNNKLGPILDYTLSDSLISEEFAQTTNIQLTYKVTHAKVKTEEVFIITKELGECKVYKHVITNQW